jgi:hypothetical protein
MRKIAMAAAVASLAAAMGTAQAGPVVIDGTDANDHGSTNGTSNLDGWLYMQKVLENLAATVAPGNAKVLVNVGADSSTQAGNAIDSAFNKSSLPGAGWTLVNVNGAANITTFFSTLSTSSTGIVYLPTFGNTSGDLANDEMAAINAAATAINNFVGGTGNAALGGGLFTQGENGTGAYGWLTSLIPGIVANSFSNTGLTLTADGSAAFPGLSNADLSAGPWHDFFSGSLGGLSVLATGVGTGGAAVNVIIGGGASTVIGCGQPGQPACPTPEPGSLPLAALAGLGLLGVGLLRARRS